MKKLLPLALFILLVTCCQAQHKPLYDTATAEGKAEFVLRQAIHYRSAGIGCLVVGGALFYYAETSLVPNGSTSSLNNGANSTHLNRGAQVTVIASVAMGVAGLVFGVIEWTKLIEAHDIIETDLKKNKKVSFYSGPTGTGIAFNF